MTLSGLKLVDAESASWEQILEFRKDKDARKKLRNLRLFFHRNYTGTSLDFIEDDLGRRLDEYEGVCRNFGFDTVTSALSAVFDSKSLVATIATSAAAAIAGKPLVVAGSLLTGASLEIGRVTLDILKRRHAFNKLARDHELAYIVEAKRRFS